MGPNYTSRPRIQNPLWKRTSHVGFSIRWVLFPKRSGRRPVHPRQGNGSKTHNHSLRTKCTLRYSSLLFPLTSHLQNTKLTTHQNSRNHPLPNRTTLHLRPFRFFLPLLARHKHDANRRIPPSKNKQPRIHHPLNRTPNARRRNCRFPPNPKHDLPMRSRRRLPLQQLRVHRI